LAQLARLLQGTHEFASKPFGYSNPPARLLSEALGLPATARTVERMSYGEPVTNIGKANVPMLQDDTADAMMFAAPALARVPRAAKFAVTQAAKDFAHASAAGVPHVIKPKGGNWLAGSVEKAVEPMKSRVTSKPDIASDEQWAEYLKSDPNAVVNKWLDTKLSKYIKNEMGTPEDPLRALAERGVLHAEPRTYGPSKTDDLRHIREMEGFAGQGLGRSELAKQWETASDLSVEPNLAGKLVDYPREVRENPWLAKVPPETSVYGVGNPRDLGDDLGFNHLIDELRNTVNPESGLPANLRWKYQDLDKVTVPQAVERVAAINDWRAAQKVAADQARANNAAAFTHKDYEDAPYKWVELKKPDDLPEGWTTTTDRFGKEQWVDSEGKLQEVNRDPRHAALEDALKYEGETMGHCVGGYCPDVLEGKSRIFSLRNKKTGEPHVTVETSPQSFEGQLWLQKHDPKLFSKYFTDESGAGKSLSEWLQEYHPETSAAYEAASSQVPEKIVQIKGKANKAPKEEYLPFVQDFVRSGKWGEVGDLSNARMQRSNWTPELIQEMKQHGVEAPEYGTAEEINSALNALNKAKGFAEGGLVGHAEYSPLEVDYIIGNVMSGQHETPEPEHGYAEGGLVEYNPAKISSLVNALREELNA